MSIMDENWHAIEGPGGQCACGPDFGRCGDRLRAYIEQLERDHRLAVNRLDEATRDIAALERTVARYSDLAGGI